MRAPHGAWSPGYNPALFEQCEQGGHAPVSADAASCHCGAVHYGWSSALRWCWLTVRSWWERHALRRHSQNEQFYALIMAAARQADSENFERLRAAFPETIKEVQARYDAPGGRLPGDGR
jgi:hypothetical protein